MFHVTLVAKWVPIYNAYHSMVRYPSIILEDIPRGFDYEIYYEAITWISHGFVCLMASIIYFHRLACVCFTLVPFLPLCRAEQTQTVFICRFVTPTDNEPAYTHLFILVLLMF